MALYQINGFFRPNLVGPIGVQHSVDVFTVFQIRFTNPVYPGINPRVLVQTLPGVSLAQTFDVHGALRPGPRFYGA